MIPENHTKLKMRVLETGDIFTVVNMLKKLSKSTLPNLMVSVVGTNNKNKTPDMISIGMQVLNELYASLEDDLLKWLSSLVNMEIDDFYSTPIDTIPNIIEELVNNEEYKSFFLQVYKLYKKIPESKKNIKKN